LPVVGGGRPLPARHGPAHPGRPVHRVIAADSPSRTACSPNSKLCLGAVP
jgi:hypothetical protein